MEQERFDALTRIVASEPGSRRQALRALGGLLLKGGLGGVAAQLGLTEVAAGKPRRQGKSKHKRNPHRERHEHGSLRTAGKGKSKGKGKGKHKPHKKPENPEPSPSSPPAPEPQLCDAYCDLEGGRCCHGECIDPSMCCYPEEKTCGDGSCVAADVCCFPEERSCDGGVCVPRQQCCPGEKPCQGGCVPTETCCPSDPYPECSSPCDEIVCKNGAWACNSNHECPSGGTYNHEHCRCEFCEVICNATTHLCQAIGCNDGEWCTDGFCGTACTEDPQLPQLCCAEDATGEVDCYCTGANSICYWCHSSLCACVPGHSCCDPDVHGPFCPGECRCPCTPESPQSCD